MLVQVCALSVRRGPMVKVLVRDAQNAQTTRIPMMRLPKQSVSHVQLVNILDLAQLFVQTVLLENTDQKTAI